MISTSCAAVPRENKAGMMRVPAVLMSGKVHRMNEKPQGKLFKDRLAHCMVKLHDTVLWGALHVSLVRIMTRMFWETGCCHFLAAKQDNLPFLSNPLSHLAVAYGFQKQVLYK